MVADLKTRVEQFFATYMATIGRQDAAGMAALYATGGLLVNPAGPQTDLVEFYGDGFKAGINRAQITVDQAWPVAAGVALSIGTFRATGKDHSGAPLEVAGNLTATWVEESGKLKIRMLNVIPRPPAPVK
jgi:ketosteroid isomerase-like protein